MKKNDITEKNISGSIREKNGVWHIVIIYYDSQGNRKFPSASTGLTIKGNKRKAQKLLDHVLKEFEIPKDDEKPNLKQYLKPGSSTNKQVKKKIEKSKPIKISSKDIKEDMLFSDFLIYWIKTARASFEENTYGSYYLNIVNCISPYFRDLDIRLNELTTIDIQDYYTYCLSEQKLSPNTVLKRHNNINQALKYAISLRLIQDNPATSVIKPKKVPYTGTAYTQEELDNLFRIFKDDPLELAVYLASFY